MGLYWLALLSAAATQAVNIGIMLVKGRRKDKGDRISDLHSAQNARFADLHSAQNARFADLQSTVNDRFAEHREDMDRRFAEHREDMDRRFAESREDMDRRFTDMQSTMNDRFAEMRADADRNHAALVALITAQGQDIKDLDHGLTDKFTGELRALDHRLTGELKAQGERTDRVLDVLRDHGERLARIEVKLDIDPSAEAALRLSAPQPAP